MIKEKEKKQNKTTKVSVYHSEFYCGASDPGSTAREGMMGKQGMVVGLIGGGRQGKKEKRMRGGHMF